MKKWIKRIGVTLLTIIVLYGIGRLVVVTYDSYVFVPRQPYLQMQTTNSITLKWQTPKKERGCVHYANNDIIKKICETNESDKHHVVITDLTPNTRYTYSVDSNSLKIDNTNRYFTTLNPELSPMQRIWVIGDSGKPGPDQDKVLAQMLKHLKGNALDLWLLLGDNAYSSGKQKQYNKGLFQPYVNQIKHLVPWAVNGNHDGRRWAFYNIFEFPTKGESGGIPSGSEKFYSIDSGNVHIVMLDSYQGNLDKDAPMATWLNKDLAVTNKPWIIVAFHHPAYTDGGHDSDNPNDSRGFSLKQGRLFQVRKNILPILEKYDVDLVLTGHSHDYERSKLIHQHYGTSDTFSPQKNIVDNSEHNYHKSITKTPYGGTIYNVSGSAAKKDNGRLKHPALPFSYATMGSLLLSVTPQKMHVEFITIDGEVGDFYTITKE